jgi:sugar O-acyltransferase (sialic acid O-acetyltransferase NeuD family)
MNGSSGEEILMKTLYLCGAGNTEGVRLALRIHRECPRWNQIVLLDDDESKHGQSILGVKIAGSFSLLQDADPEFSEVVNLVTRTTAKRCAARRKIRQYGLPFAPLIDPGVDMVGVEHGDDVTVFSNAFVGALAVVDSASVVLMGSIVGHGCRVGRCCVVAPHAVINARVEIGDAVYVGTNATILPDVTIGAWATIGAGSVVMQNVAAGATVMGIPAKTIWKLRPEKLFSVDGEVP